MSNIFFSESFYLPLQKSKAAWREGGREGGRERARERQTDRERDRQRETERDRQRETERQREEKSISLLLEEETKPLERINKYKILQLEGV